MFRLLLFVVNVMVANVSTASGVSACPVDKVPIQITSKGSSPKSTLSDTNRAGFFSEHLSGNHPHFRAFVTAVTEHTAARLAKEKCCLDSAESQKRSLLQFVDWPLFNNKSLASVPPLDAQPSGGCRISSPWMDLAFERKPVPWIRGIVRWNQRQLFADQAVLSGANNVPLGVAKPLTYIEMGHFLGEYERWRFHHESEATPLEEHMPPDILWLFGNSIQSTAMPFVGFVQAAMNKATAKGAEGYTKVVIALIDRCFAANGASLEYKSILDIADPILLEQYKIDMTLY
ncbi:hypothetical protein FDZ73_18955 [bacterium]|nr:MAG: hypothetical protein FDZ73_18955 [bacterium]